MKLNKRIKLLATLIPEDKRVIDVGCDHALLDIYLTLNNKNKCIASDINENALENAKKNIKKYNLDIETIVSDGLSNIELQDDDVIVISGMGTNTIQNILNNAKLKKNTTLIIQTNNNLFELRRFVVNLDFKIDEELGFIDKNKRYTQIRFVKGKSKYKNIEYCLGPILMKKHDQDTIDYFKSMLKENIRNLDAIPKKYIFKRIEIKNINKKIKKLLSF